MIYPPDQPVTLEFRTYSDAAKTILADPDTAVIDVTRPDGTTATHTWPSGDFTRASLGIFRYVVTNTTTGYYRAHAHSTGTVATSQDYKFEVGTKYVTVEDLRLILAGTENSVGTAASLSDEDLADAIDEAQAEVDARLDARYATPFTGTPPALVAAITRDIAAYLATLTYRRGEPIQTGDPVLLRYQRAQALLKQAVDGTLVFPENPGGTTASTPTVANPYDGDLWAPSDFRLAQTPAGLTPWRFPG